MIAAVLMGAAAGVVSGLLGVGGGILFVPALTLALSLSQVKAEATSLLAIIPVALVGAWRQYGYGNVDVRDSAIVGALSALGVLAGVALANTLSERALRFGFAALMLVVAMQFLRRWVGARRAAQDSSIGAADSGPAATGSSREAAGSPRRGPHSSDRGHDE
jgi:uncharacterized membrane protein YfcA